MSTQRAINVTGCLTLGLVAAAALLLPDSVTVPSAVAGGVSTELRLNGVVRDFQRSHVDFDVAVTGHSAGNTALALDADSRPVFVGGGHGVVAPWEDALNRAIPSHLYGDGVRPRLAVASTFELADTCIVDSFDSRDGPYGGANVDQDAILSIDAVGADAVRLSGSSWFRGDVLVGQGGDPNVVIDDPARVTGTTGSLPQPINLPVIELPTDVGPYLGDQDFNGDTVDIDTNLHWGDVLAVGTLFRVDGHRTILVRSLDIDAAVNDFVFEPDSSLKIYCTDWMEIDDDANLNMDNGAPSRLTIYMTGTYDGSGDEEETGLVDIEDGAEITADIVAPNGKLLMENGTHVYGTFVGDAVELRADSQIHVDRAVFSSGCATADGAAGIVGAAGDGGVDSAASFAEWYRDVMGTNLSVRHTVTLTRDGGGVFTLLDDDFHPIDDRMFGNEGEPHNNYLTYHIDATFRYNACWGQFLEFEGGDGTWVFIDGQLVMDLGGVDSATPQYVEMDRLGLTDGETYRLHLFYSQRNAASSVFRMRTTLDLVTPDYPIAVTAAFD